MGKFGISNSRAAKLTGMQVIEIRERYAAGATQASLAREYGVTVVTVGRIVRGEAWQHLQTIADPQVIDKPLPPMTPEMEADAKASEERVLAMLRKDIVKEQTRTNAVDEWFNRNRSRDSAERKDDDSRGRADDKDQPQGQSGAEQEQKE